MYSQVQTQKKVIDALVVDRDSIRIKLENQLQYTRRNMLFIHGVGEKAREDTDKVVLEVAEKVGVNLDQKNINRSHRLGPKRQNLDKKPRPIILSLISYAQKKELYDNKKKLKGTKIFISESLTQSRCALYEKCIERFGKNNCWTYDGRIFCVNPEDDNAKLCIESDEDLANI